MSKLQDILTNLPYDEAQEAEQQIKDLMLEIVGKNGDVPKHDNMSMTEIRYQAAELGMNSLRADMRQRIQEL